MEINNRNSTSFGLLKILPSNKGKEAQGIVSRWCKPMARRIGPALEKGDEVSFKLRDDSIEENIANELKEQGIPYFRWNVPSLDVSGRDTANFIRTKFSDLLTCFSNGCMLEGKRVKPKAGVKYERFNEMPDQSEYEIHAAHFVALPEPTRRVIHIIDNSGTIHEMLLPQHFELLPD